MAWSSASSTRITGAPSLGRQRDVQRAPPTRSAGECVRPSQHLHAVLAPAESEVAALHAHVLLAREHALRVESPAIVRDGELDGAAPARHGHALAGGARVAVAVREPLLENAIDGDLRRQGAVAEVVG